MSEEPDWVPDDWNDLQSLASDHGIKAVGRSREDIVEDLKQVKDTEEPASDDDELLEEDGTDPTSEKTVEIEKQEPDTEADEDEEPEEEQVDETEEPPETEVSENTIDLEKYMGDDASSSTVSSEDEDSQDHRGMAEAVNRAWGRIWTMDLDPDGTMPEGDQEVSAVRKNLCGLAQDVGLGENVKRFYEEEIKTGEEADPKKAMFGSLLMAVLLSASARPDAVRKLKKEIQPEEGGGSDGDA